MVPNKDQRGMYILLDGHFRLDVVKQLGHQQVRCLVATGAALRRWHSMPICDGGRDLQKLRDGEELGLGSGPRADRQVRTRQLRLRTCIDSIGCELGPCSECHVDAAKSFHRLWQSAPRWWPFGGEVTCCLDR